MTAGSGTESVSSFDVTADEATSVDLDGFVVDRRRFGSSPFVECLGIVTDEDPPLAGPEAGHDLGGGTVG